MTSGSSGRHSALETALSSWLSSDEAGRELGLLTGSDAFSLEGANRFSGLSRNQRGA
jgi:hypothetical protein